VRFFSFWDFHNFARSEIPKFHRDFETLLVVRVWFVLRFRRRLARFRNFACSEIPRFLDSKISLIPRFHDFFLPRFREFSYFEILKFLMNFDSSRFLDYEIDVSLRD
jgi:hypothetical protein